MKINKNFIEPKLHKKILNNMPVCTVDVLFFNKEKTKTLLFLRNDKPLKNLFFSIGGRLNKNETLENCAARKVKEEIGYKISKYKLIFGGVISEIHENSIYKNINYHAVDLFYGYIVNNNIEKNIIFDNQHNSYKWHKINDKNLHPFLKKKINILLKKL